MNKKKHDKQLPLIQSVKKKEMNVETENGARKERGGEVPNKYTNNELCDEVNSLAT